MESRCFCCGCLLKYRAQAVKESLATPEQERALFEQVRGQEDPTILRDRLAPFGHRQVWIIVYQCPGCGLHGSHYGAQYPRQEAEAIAAVQNDLAHTPEAEQQAAHWKQTVRRKAQNDARYFADYFLCRFPHWKSRVRIVEPEEERGAQDQNDLEWDCALIARLPCENPHVDALLEVRVLCREVRLSWGDFWHTHVYADVSADSADPEHLRRAVAEVEAIVTEQIVICACYREGQFTSGCALLTGTEPTPPWTLLDLAHPACGDQMVLRSWRGTQDRIIDAHSDSGRVVTP